MLLLSKLYFLNSLSLLYSPVPRQKHTASGGQDPPEEGLGAGEAEAGSGLDVCRTSWGALQIEWWEHAQFREIVTQGRIKGSPPRLGLPK